MAGQRAGRSRSNGVGGGCRVGAPVSEQRGIGAIPGKGRGERFRFRRVSVSVPLGFSTPGRGRRGWRRSSRKSAATGRSAGVGSEGRSADGETTKETGGSEGGSPGGGSGFRSGLGRGSGQDSEAERGRRGSGSWPRHRGLRGCRVAEPVRRGENEETRRVRERVGSGGRGSGRDPRGERTRPGSEAPVDSADEECIAAIGKRRGSQR